MGIIAKQSIQGTIVTYLGVAVGFVTTFFVLTRFLSAEEIGLARVLVDAATLFIGLAQLALPPPLVASIRILRRKAKSTPKRHERFRGPRLGKRREAGIPTTDFSFGH